MIGYRHGGRFRRRSRSERGCCPEIVVFRPRFHPLCFHLAMAFDECNALPPEQQLATVYATGRFVRTRRKGTLPVNLYVVPTALLVEVRWSS